MVFLERDFPPLGTDCAGCKRAGHGEAAVCSRRRLGKRGILVSGKGGGLSGQVKDAPDPMEALDRFFVGAQAQAQLALKAAHAPGEFDHEQAVALETGGTFLRKNPPPPAAILSLEKASGS